ncbi:UNVERIFIED_CONTAM: hypothetical protein GTU68_033896 [Idotea baltica]|nr:hypothetical protein [Idotea baltica]
MKLSEDQMKHVLKPGVTLLSDIFKRNGFEIRVAGGAVRDLLMDIIPTDLDFATPATPDEMKQIFEKEEIRMINRGGEKHGTITARIEEENFECTTLRVDKVTDGRHAEVQFIRDWELDAGRRDLTINALFLGLDGTVYDYFDGIEHLKNRKVTFVGDPDKRIKEDYLRILRYYRFFGRIAMNPSAHDPEIISSIMNNCEGLGKISGERIWIEVKKIVQGRYGGELVQKMVECKVGPQIGLPHYYDCENLIKVSKQFENFQSKDSCFHPCTLLASGFTSEQDAIHFTDRIKCSNKEKDILMYIVRNRDSYSNIKSIKLIQDLLVDMVYKDKKSKDLSVFLASELVKYVGREDLLSEISIDLIPLFPIKGGMLVNKVKNKKHIQAETRKLLDIWKRSDFTLGTKELLNELEP